MQVLMRASEVPADLARFFEPLPNGDVRDVFEIATEPYKNAHFATFPTKLVERCILAGTSERGCCPVCGKPWERETETSYEKSPVHGAGSVVGRHYETGANNFDGAGMPRLNKRVETLGWRPGCDCGEYVCTACDTVPEHGSSTTQLSDVQDGVHPEGSPREAPVLLEAVRGRGEAEGAADADLRGVRDGVLVTEGHALPPEEVLLAAVQPEARGEEQAADARVRDLSQGLQVDPIAAASDGEPRGVRDGASPSDGRTSRQDADGKRGRASRQRRQDGQPSGEPRRNDNESTQSVAQAAAQADCMSPLRRDDAPEQSCPQCDGALTRVPHKPVPATILDPFLGSGTSAHVARKHGRRSVGIELNEDYCRLAARRMQQQSLFAQEAV